MLVYHYRASESGAPAVKDGLAVVRQPELDRILEESKCKHRIDRVYSTNRYADPGLQQTVKQIPRGTLVIRIQQQDLLTDAQLNSVDHNPNAESNVASIRVPIRAFVASVFDDKYWKLVILLKKY